MADEIGSRFEELVSQGRQIVAALPRDQHGVEFWSASDKLAATQAWISSVSNLITVVAEPGSHFISEVNRLLEWDYMKNGIPTSTVQKFLGMVESAQAEWKSGLLRRIEYIVAAETFDDFLDHAEAFHKSNKKIEAAVLASAVLEDTMKKVAQRNKVASKGINLEPLIDELVRAGVTTPVKAKRIKSHAAVRNHALHADWEAFDIKDVGEMISGLRSLIEEFL